jgi:hypothetical protein
MPDWLSKNLPAFITLVVISAGGIASFARMEAKIQTLEERVTRLEASQDNMLSLLNKVDRKLALLLCKTDPNFCLER